MLKKSKKVAKTVKRETKKYKLEMFFNGFHFETKTNDIRESILSFSPGELFTEVFITITEKAGVRDRKLTLRQGKNLFMNEVFTDVFISNLLSL